MELLRKLGQRETWLYLAGMGIAIYYVAAPAASLHAPENPEFLIGVVAALIGPGAYAHVKRGEQRGKEVVKVATAKLNQAQALEGEEEEEGPWN